MADDSEYDELLYMPVAFGYRDKHNIFFESRTENPSNLSQFNDWDAESIMNSISICNSIHHNKIERLIAELWFAKKNVTIEYGTCYMCKNKLNYLC